jgi:predicted esterase
MPLYYEKTNQFFCIPLLWSLFISFAAAKDDSPLKWGYEASREICADSLGYLWVTHELGNDCVRYQASHALDGNKGVVIYFSGDRDSLLKVPINEIRNNTVAQREKVARNLSANLGVPVILVGRPGTYGTSGDHRLRLRLREFTILKAAVDRLRSRYALTEMTLVGHSGGATAAAALLTLSVENVRCVVLTSGAFGLMERARRRALEAGREFDITGRPILYDPLDNIEKIPKINNRKIYVLGNEYDKVTPFDLQQRFYTALRDQGHNAELRRENAPPPRFHNLEERATTEAVVSCNAG